MDWNWSLTNSVNNATAASDGTGSDILSKLLSGRPPATPNVQTATGSGPAVDPMTGGTGLPGNNPNDPTFSGGRWQGGGVSPTQPGTNISGGRWVDPTYQRDATGRQLTPEEQAAWRQYDTSRAQYASTAASANHGGSSTTGANGQKIIFNERANTWSLMDPGTKKWEDGIKTADIYGRLTGDLKAANPEWYYGQAANSATDQRMYELNRQTGQYAQNMGATNQTTRYPTYGI